MENSLPDRFVQIDEQGLVVINERPVTDPKLGAEVLNCLEFSPQGCFVSRSGAVPVIVEAFDEPLIAIDINLDRSTITINYDVEFPIKFETFTVDEWDRFHGLTTKGIPFVLSAAAQDSLFNQADEFDDDSFTFKGKKIELGKWLDDSETNSKVQFWNEIYQTQEQLPWSLHQASPLFEDMVPRLKLTKARIIVLGAGEGHDAAYFAREGHIVTAVDYSDQAIERGKKLYSDLSNLKWIKADVLKLTPEHFGQYDYVIEHTCYCAISPMDRNSLVKMWKNLLTERGHLIAAFFAMHKPKGPPYGGSEWEIRQRLKSGFHFIFWGRWKASSPARQGKELFVFAQKKNLL